MKIVAPAEDFRRVEIVGEDGLVSAIERVEPTEEGQTVFWRGTVTAPNGDSLVSLTGKNLNARQVVLTVFEMLEIARN